MIWRRYWFSLGMVGVCWGAIALRFWQLDRIDQLVFDEIYYVKYAVAYLTQQPVFDAHPPFAKYLIALGIWLGEHLWFRDAAVRVAVGGLAETVSLSPLSFRWLNALVGATIPLLIAGVALELSGRRSLALLAGLFATLDGFLLVESRFALLHVYLVAFGLLGQWCFLKAWRSPLTSKEERVDAGSWLLNAGLSFGAAVSVKWNGLGYWLVPAGLWVLGQRSQRSQNHQRSQNKKQNPDKDQGDNPDRDQTRSHPPRWLSGGVYLGLIPALFYGLLWLPHLRVQTEVGFFPVHQQILGFHQGMDDEAGAAHPYCSSWWSWPLMLRPIAYFFSRSDQGRSSVLALGNPLLWWLATGAMLLLGGALGWTAWRRWLWRLESGGAASAVPNRGDRGEAVATPALLILDQRDREIATYLLLNYAANWLPWLLVKRCTFTYHHLGAMAFGMIAVAFWCDRGFRLGRSGRSEYGWVAGLAVGAIALAFLFWLPLYLGLPLSELGLRLRLWLPSWI